MNKVWEDEKAVKDMLKAYETGQTVKQIAKQFGLSAGKAYYTLRDAGCKFRERLNWNGKHTEHTKQLISKANKGKIVSEETRKRISGSRNKHFDGMNSIGHLKQHKSGYILAYVPDHPKATKDGYVMLHTVLMERAIGRYLADDEEVHHINSIRNDNRLENLRLMKKYEHHSMHMRIRMAQKKGEMAY